MEILEKFGIRSSDLNYLIDSIIIDDNAVKEKVNFLGK